MSAVSISLVELELDALRETANIATARAARALGVFMRRSVWMSAPMLRWSPGPWGECDAGVAQEATVAVGSGVHGALDGSILFLVTAATARGIARLLLGPSGGDDMADPVVRSSIVETANVLGGTYLTALAALTGGVFKVSAPSFGCVPESALWQGLEDSGEWPVAGLCLETALRIGNVEHALPCRLYLLSDRGAFANVLAGLKAWS